MPRAGKGVFTALTCRLAQIGIRESGPVATGCYRGQPPDNQSVVITLQMLQGPPTDTGFITCNSPGAALLKLI